MKQRRANLEKEKAGREEEYIDWTMVLDEWREVLNIYTTMEERKKAKSTKVQRKFAKTNCMQNNLCKKRGNKKAIDRLAVTISRGNSDSDNDSNKVMELEACIDF